MLTICAKSDRQFLMFILLMVASIGQAQQSEPWTQARELPQRVEAARQIPFEEPFTFVRIQYSSGLQETRFPAWATDYPDADRAFSRQFEALTGFPTNVEGLTSRLTNPALNQYPFIYLVEGGRMRLSDEEASALREYLLGGGFLMVDDFWGAYEWESFTSQLSRAFPDKRSVALTKDHAIFRSFFRFADLPHVPSLGGGRPGEERGYWGLVDDDGRLMAIFCHNVDIGDGWEHMRDPRYSREASLGGAIPLGVNIVVHALSN